MPFQQNRTVSFSSLTGNLRPKKVSPGLPFRRGTTAAPLEPVPEKEAGNGVFQKEKGPTKAGPLWIYRLNGLPELQEPNSAVLRRGGHPQEIHARGDFGEVECQSVFSCGIHPLG